MIVLLFFAIIFSPLFAVQVPVCKSVKQDGFFTQVNSQSRDDSIGNFSFDLSVAFNNNNPSFPNTLTVTNFSEWYNDTSIFNRINPWGFTFFGNPNKKIECASTSNCSFQFPNGEVLYYLNYDYNNNSYTQESITVPKIFVNDGIFFDGETSELWDPSDLMCMGSRSSENESLFFYASLCGSKFENISIPDSNNDICQEFESNTSIIDPSLNSSINLLAHYSVQNNSLKIDISLLNSPDPAYIYYIYIGYPFLSYANGSATNPNSSLTLDLRHDSQYEILFDYNSTAIDSGNGIFKYGGVNVGEIIMRNGMFLKNNNQTYTSTNPCWTKNASVPFTNASYQASVCCKTFKTVTNSTTTIGSTATMSIIYFLIFHTLFFYFIKNLIL